MPVLELIIILIVIGVALYLVGLIPMDAKILTVIRAVVIVLVVLWVLSLFFDFGGYTVGRVHHFR